MITWSLCKGERPDTCKVCHGLGKYLERKLWKWPALYRDAIGDMSESFRREKRVGL